MYLLLFQLELLPEISDLKRNECSHLVTILKIGIRINLKSIVYVNLIPADFRLY